MPLDLNYHHLYYFWVCVRAGSLTAASRELHLSQSALSLQLKSLERALGRRLLDRSRSGVLPTADGRLVFERCERIFPEGESLSNKYTLFGTVTSGMPVMQAINAQGAPSTSSQGTPTVIHRITSVSIKES